MSLFSILVSGPEWLNVCFTLMCKPIGREPTEGNQCFIEGGISVSTALFLKLIDEYFSFGVNFLNYLKKNHVCN